jgi:hypothetical protein
MTFFFLKKKKKIGVIVAIMAEMALCPAWLGENGWIDGWMDGWILEMCR